MSVGELPDRGPRCWRCKCLLEDDDLGEDECDTCYWIDYYGDDDWDEDDE